MNEDKNSYVYILFSKRNGTLYIGVTSNLIKRIYEHKNKLVDGSRRDKLALIESVNPDWIDLYDTIID